MAGGYADGEVFISIVPSFRGWGELVDREARLHGATAGRAFAAGFAANSDVDPLSNVSTARARQQGATSGRLYREGFEQQTNNLNTGTRGAAAQAAREGAQAGALYARSFERETNRVNPRIGGNGAQAEAIRAGHTAGSGWAQGFSRATGAVNPMANVDGPTAQALRRGAQTGEAWANGFNRATSHLNPRTNVSVSGAARDGARAATENADAVNVDAAVSPGQLRASILKAIAEAQRSLPEVNVDVDADVTPAQRRVQELRAELGQLHADVELGLDADTALVRMRELRAELVALAADNVDVNVEVNADTTAAAARLAALGAMRVEPEVTPQVQLGRLRSDLLRATAAAQAAMPEIEVDADTTPAQLRGEQLRAELNALHADIELGLDADTAIARMAQIRAELAALSRGRHGVDIEVNTNALRAAAELNALEAATHRAGSRSNDATNSFRAFSAIVLGVAALGPLVVPTLGAIAAGLATIGPAAAVAGAGLLPLIAGFGGLGKAIGAMGKVREQSTQDGVKAAKQDRSSAKAIEDAQRGIQRARESGARAVKSAAERIADAKRREVDAARAVVRAAESEQQAQKGLTDAIRDQESAQRGLIKARAEGARQIEDLKNKGKSAALDIRDANLDLARAQDEFNRVVVQGAPGEYTSVDREEASIGLERAKIRVEEAKKAAKDIGKAQAEANKTGVEGTDPVIRAKEAIKSANDRVVQSERQVRDAARATADAQRGVADAQRNTAKAREAYGQAQVDSARSVADAERALTEALVAQVEGADAASSSMNALNTAMANLSPAGQKFAKFIYSLRGQWKELQAIAQSGMLPGLQRGIETTLDALYPTIKSFTDGMSKAFGQGFEDLGDALAGPLMRPFFTMLDQFGPVFVKQWGDIFGNLGLAFAQLLTAFAPFSKEMGDGLVKLTKRFADWTLSWSKSKSFQEFLNFMRRTTPIVGALLGSFARALTAIIVALEPYAEGLAKGLIGFFNWLADLDPKTIRAIAVATVGVVLAFQAFFGLKTLGVFIGTIVKSFGALRNVFSAVMLTLRGAAGGISLVTLGWAVLAVAIAAFFALIYKVSPEFREFVGVLVDGAKQAFGQLIQWVKEAKGGFDKWLPTVIPLLQELGRSLAKMGYAAINALKPLLPVVRFVGGILWWLFTTVLKHAFTLAVRGITINAKIITVIFNALGAVFRWIGRVFSAAADWMAGVWRRLGGSFGEIYRRYIRTPFQWLDIQVQLLQYRFRLHMSRIGDRWQALGTSLKNTYNRYIKAPIQALVDKANSVKAQFGKAISGIGAQWARLTGFFKKPVRAFVNVILNGALMKGLRAVAKAVGWKTAIPDVTLPKGFNTGGHVGGYSPHKRADNIPAWLTAGEFVQPVDTVNYYGKGFMEKLRKRQIPRFADGGSVPGFAWGGQVPPAGHAKGGLAALMQFGRWLRSMGYRVAEGPGEFGPITGGHAKNSMHYKGRAIDVNSRPGQSAAEQRELDAIMPFARAFGLRSIWRVAGHFNHAHFDTGRGKDLLGRVIGGFKDLVGKLGDLASKPFTYLTDKVKGLLPQVGGGQFADILKYGAKGLTKRVADKIKSMLNPFKADDKEPDPSYPSGSGDVVGQVRKAAKLRGWDSGAQWNALSWIISKESGWNPNAKNPTSTAYGLFQFLNGTWGSTLIPKTSDPYRQALAGTNYIANRYGKPSDAKSFHQSHGWYSEGGPVEAPKVYDTGGWLQPGKTAINLSQKPEPIFTGNQWDTLRQSLEGRSGGGDTYNLYQQQGESLESFLAGLETKRRLESRSR